MTSGVMPWSSTTNWTDSSSALSTPEKFRWACQTGLRVSVMVHVRRSTPRKRTYIRRDQVQHQELL